MDRVSGEGVGGCLRVVGVCPRVAGEDGFSNKFRSHTTRSRVFTHSTLGLRILDAQGRLLNTVDLLGCSADNRPGRELRKVSAKVSVAVKGAVVQYNSSTAAAMKLSGSPAIPNEGGGGGGDGAGAPGPARSGTRIFMPLRIDVLYVDPEFVEVERIGHTALLRIPENGFAETVGLVGPDGSRGGFGTITLSGAVMRKKEHDAVKLQV